MACLFPFCLLRPGIPVRVAYAIWLRTPMAVDLSEVIINAVMLAAVIKTRGNVVQILKYRGLNMEIKTIPASCWY